MKQNIYIQGLYLEWKASWSEFILFFFLSWDLEWNSSPTPLITKQDVLFSDMVQWLKSWNQHSYVLLTNYTPCSYLASCSSHVLGEKVNSAAFSSLVWTIPLSFFLTFQFWGELLICDYLYKKCFVGYLTVWALFVLYRDWIRKHIKLVCLIIYLIPFVVNLFS